VVSAPPATTRPSGERSHRRRGARQEASARAWLEARGFRVVDANYTVRGGELDLVIMDGSTCCFVEVRSRRGNTFGTALESITPRKMKRLVLAARRWLSEHDQDAPVRFDVMSRDGEATAWCHVTDAFRPEEP